jgi:hypothetical protein
VRLDKSTFEKLPESLKETLIRKYPVETQRFQSKKFSAKKNKKKQQACDGVKFSPWPTKNPAHKLHQLLVNQFGDYFRHPEGVVAHEVLLEGAPKRWRYDHCIVPARVFIEFNGWQNHHLLDAFQRDHEKKAYALTQGFVVYDITNKMVMESPELIIKQLKQIISHRNTHNDDVVRVGYAYCKIVNISTKI